jgi:hypothetical protein
LFTREHTLVCCITSKQCLLCYCLLSSAFIFSSCLKYTIYIRSYHGVCSYHSQECTSIVLLVTRINAPFTLSICYVCLCNLIDLLIDRLSICVCFLASVLYDTLQCYRLLWFGVPEDSIALCFTMLSILLGLS